MIDRDYFAAAALTRGMGVLGYEQIAKSCYEMADAMLRERERTNHDAVPEAIAYPSESSVPRGNGGGCGGTDKPVTLPAMGTGNTQTAPPCVKTDGPPSQAEVADLRGKVVQLRRVIDMMQARQFAVASAVREMTAVQAPPMELWECDDVI